MTPTCLHIFAGAGGGALGFHRAGFRSLGSFDVDAKACRDLEYLTGEPATVLDIGTATSVDLHTATRGETPDVVFTSPPCKGFSGCLPTKSAKTSKYTDMNSLAERGIYIALEAWERKPPLIIMENVPRMRERGAEWLARVIKMLQANGYAVDDRTHDCGVVGGLAQHRRRLLIVARHMEQVPVPLRLPPEQRVRGVGEVLGKLPVPISGSTAGGPMHALPRLIPMTWLRLALIPAGGDWRDLPESVAIRYQPHNGSWGVQDWARASPTVKGCHQYSNATGAVSDPRLGCSPRSGSYGVAGWLDPSGTVLAHHRHDSARATVADPRLTCSPRPSSYGVQPWAEPSHTIRGAHTVQGCRAAIDDPRVPLLAGEPSLELESRKPCHLVIRAADGTWHRPLTTLELAVIQGFPKEVNGKPLQLAGQSHQRWRQAIGNAVPPPSSEAIATECRRALESSRSGTFALSSQGFWVSRDQAEASL